ncbi:alpha-glucan family phosphorylase [Candidatus Methylacidiphilum infernorum]|uniref:Alpha-glucan family phosphorylase n=1 Tax=Candidatus Methylacidiphilum infernorum TaxID=511746 RepID=A0ABX7PT92_9BACT|nr:alpha-glucan family phosphorylase [Candidatus Methylacidiphilum infernorum]QSR86195.1 alpha-glucan family phosphorylase [Candidatus Methylacidiphilum infernorum]
MISTRYLFPEIPEELKGLEDLASDMLWHTVSGSRRLWRKIDPLLWESTSNPWFILERLSKEKIKALSQDPEFQSLFKCQLEERKRYFEQKTWFEENFPYFKGHIAYFSMEFGLGEELPIYSGGLGILAGDYLKAASDLGLPVVGIGLLYQQGYFRQLIDSNGEQVEFYPYNDPALLPVFPLRDDSGEWISIEVPLPGRSLVLRPWYVIVGRVSLYLLDSNDPANMPSDRTITSTLYGGDNEMRLLQEIVLGIGGWKLLSKLGIECNICHLNEGHAAFAILERAKDYMQQMALPSFWTALWATRSGNLFTTHTPVEAGFDRFAPSLFLKYFFDFCQDVKIAPEELLALGQLNKSKEEPFNMAYLALRGSAATNGVSKLHEKVSQTIFRGLFPRWPTWQIPIGSVTNGVHVATWHSQETDELWTSICGKDLWRQPTEKLEEKFRSASDCTLWEWRKKNRLNLILALRKRSRCHCAMLGKHPDIMSQCSCLFDPNVLTIGFARRFASYKRPTLLLHDKERLVKIITDPHKPVQLVVAGKAHPQDQVGKAMIREWTAFVARKELHNRVVFVEDYDMRLALDLVQGIDLWINNPRRPWEASGTSGMKVVVNGGLNLSELDGWWAEAYSAELGWAIGDGKEHGEDPAWDAFEADQLYSLLEKEIIPAFYDRDERGIPQKWVNKIRESAARLTPFFSANRMVREYTNAYYIPLCYAAEKRRAKSGELARELEKWKKTIATHWNSIHFGNFHAVQDQGQIHFSIQVYLDEIPPDWVVVELYADPKEQTAPFCNIMEKGEALVGALNGFTYRLTVNTQRPPEDFTPRIRPYHPDAFLPTEAPEILWYK